MNIKKTNKKEKMKKKMMMMMMMMMTDGFTRTTIIMVMLVILIMLVMLMYVYSCRGLRFQNEQLEIMCYSEVSSHRGLLLHGFHAVNLYEFNGWSSISEFLSKTPKMKYIILQKPTSSMT